MIAKNGVVTLTGFVHSYNEKVEGERAAKRVAGVVGVANDIEVHLRDVDERPDPEIAREVVAALRRELPVSWERIKVAVAHGRVKLEGDLEWRYQRQIAERTVRRIHGVPAVVFAGLWFLMQVLQASTELILPTGGGSIAWWAHIGGFTAGFVLASPLRHSRRPAWPRYDDQGILGFDLTGR